MELHVHGLVATGDGRVVIRMSRRGDDPELVGAEVAHALLVEGGGSGIEGFDEAALSRRGTPGPDPRSEREGQARQEDQAPREGPARQQ